MAVLWIDMSNLRLLCLWQQEAACWLLLAWMPLQGKSQLLEQLARWLLLGFYAELKTLGEFVSDVANVDVADEVAVVELQMVG